MNATNNNHLGTVNFDHDGDYIYWKILTVYVFLKHYAIDQLRQYYEYKNSLR